MGNKPKSLDSQIIGSSLTQSQNNLFDLGRFSSEPSNCETHLTKFSRSFGDTCNEYYLEKFSGKGLGPEIQADLRNLKIGAI